MKMVEMIGQLASGKAHGSLAGIDALGSSTGTDPTSPRTSSDPICLLPTQNPIINPTIPKIYKIQHQLNVVRCKQFGSFL